MIKYEKPIAEIIELCPAEKQMMNISEGNEDWDDNEDW